MPGDSRQYRRLLGFSNQEKLKKFFKFTDIIIINWDKIERQNQRLKEIFSSINRAINVVARWDNMEQINNEIDNAYTIIRENNILDHLNNYGRYREDMYYSWMRGYVVCKYFTPALARIFNVEPEMIRTVGHDSLSNVETFSRSPVADLEITIDDKRIRLEIQSGFTGQNDIKEHKVNEASRVFRNEGILTYVVHFDLFNGMMAIIDVTNIDDDDLHWETRNQMEGQRVFAIPTDAFRWFLPNEVPQYTDILY